MNRPLFALAVLLLVIGCGERPPPEDEALRFALGELLGGDAAGYARATEPRAFRFPADHGPHPDFRTEWWYLTGNLEDRQGRHFGFQLTLFRNAIHPEPTGGESLWRTRQIYMGHFALTDVAGDRFFASERLTRGAVGLAGAEAVPFRVWLEDWVIAGAPDGTFPLTVRAEDDGHAVELTLTPEKAPVPQGENGLSQKSAAPGNASYYYSYTRLAAHGEVAVDGRAYAVEGLAWMDREWSTSALAEDQAGWDWFSLQLDDGSDLMYYRLRRRDGTTDPASAGTLVGGDGQRIPLSAAEVALEPLEWWQSPEGGRYPVSWRLQIPKQSIDLRITPYRKAQELALSVRYWEGAVRVEGSRRSERLGGSGYVELTGYDEETAPAAD